MAKAKRPRKRIVVAVLRDGIKVTRNKHGKSILRKLRITTRKPPRRADGTPSFATHREDFPMADDLKQTGKPDDARINVEQEQEVRFGQAGRDLTGLAAKLDLGHAYF